LRPFDMITIVIADWVALFIEYPFCFRRAHDVPRPGG
jgi:hypothetical protein